MELPKRSADTMSEAIAIASPNGRMSKRAKEQAIKRLSIALFGPNGLQRELIQPNRKESLLNSAKNLRDLAARGMSTKRFNREAAKLEEEAAKL